MGIERKMAGPRGELSSPLLSSPLLSSPRLDGRSGRSSSQTGRVCARSAFLRPSAGSRAGGVSFNFPADGFSRVRRSESAGDQRVLEIRECLRSESACRAQPRAQASSLVSARSFPLGTGELLAANPIMVPRREQARSSSPKSFQPELFPGLEKRSRCREPDQGQGQSVRIDARPCLQQPQGGRSARSDHGWWLRGLRRKTDFRCGST